MLQTVPRSEIGPRGKSITGRSDVSENNQFHRKCYAKHRHAIKMIAYNSLVHILNSTDMTILILTNANNKTCLNINRTMTRNQLAENPIVKLSSFALHVVIYCCINIWIYSKKNLASIRN